MKVSGSWIKKNWKPVVGIAGAAGAAAATYYGGPRAGSAVLVILQALGLS